MPKKYKLKRAKYLEPPVLDNNPVWDSVVTSLMPMLSFTNASKGIGDRFYSVQISKVHTFNYKTLLEYENVPEGVGNTTSLIVDIELEDKTLYYWRVSVSDQEGNHTDWLMSRFYVDSEYCNLPSELRRVEPVHAESSGKSPVSNVLNYACFNSYWHSDYGNQETQWLQFDFGKETEISKIWTLSNPTANEETGWLIEFHWEKSLNGNSWEVLEKTITTKHRSGKSEFDFNGLNTRYMRLVIKKWTGMAAQINDIRFYTPLSGKPPKMPFADYVLIVGTQQDGSIHTPLLEALKKEFPELKTVEVPFYDFSSDFIENLNHQPKAVILSSNWVDYAKVPIFEYNGLFDFIRNSDIPTLGIAGGMHLQYMTYCTSYVRRIGYDVNDEMELAEMRKKEKNFVRQKDSPLFQGVASKFTAVELSKWEVLEEISEVIEYEILADFDYPMVVKNKLKEMYGVQFIPEIGASFNMAQNVLQNFVKLALDIHEA